MTRVLSEPAIDIVVNAESSSRYVVETGAFVQGAGALYEITLRNSAVRELGELPEPTGLAVGASGTLFFVDTNNSDSIGRLYAIDPINGAVSTASNALGEDADQLEIEAYVNGADSLIPCGDPTSRLAMETA